MKAEGLDRIFREMWVLGGRLVFVAAVGMAAGSGQLFEIVGVLNGGGDFIATTGPLAEVDEAAAVGAEGEVLVGGENDFAADRTEEGFGCGHGACSIR